jgi:hypothetical protein
MKDWETIVTISAKPDGSGAACQPLIVRGGQSGLQTRIATTESVSLCFWNWKRRFVLGEAFMLSNGALDASLWVKFFRQP